MLRSLQIPGFLWMTFSAVLVSAPMANAQPAPSPQPAPVKTAEQQYKNIKVLTGLRADQINITMHGISAELGVECVHCHVWEEWDKDVKPRKEVARRMITMVRDMNKTYFGGANVVTCYTCHRGNPRPVGTATLPDTLGLRGLTEAAPPLPVEEKPRTRPSYPSAEAIISKYVEALGGEAAIRNVTSRVIRARRDLPTAPAGLTPVLADVEIYQQAPNLNIMISKAEKFTLSEGFDGEVAWTRSATGVLNNLPEPEQQRAKRRSDFYESLNLAKNYDRMQVAGIEKVNGHDAYVVIATPRGDTAERLYFDVNTGLLLRRWWSLPTLLSAYPYQIDFDDYRKTKSGVLVPFVTRMLPAGPRLEAVSTSTLQIIEVRDNVPIEAGKFARPESKAPSSPGQ
ncbi:MAG: c-type cytochrome [Acidobacteriota bacterium]|nr:c-type cytochrome [Acidobacteriota bacterium]